MAKQKRSRFTKIPTAVLLTAKVFSLVSEKLTTRFAARLFTTPIRHKLPKRELAMETKSQQSPLAIPSINKEINVFEYGTSDRNVLLVHGWSGRGTQLVKIADALVANGYKVISFDAPAHGKSTGKTTLMPEFVMSIHEIDRKYGPFEAAIGHSLGGMSVLNAVKRGFKTKKLVTIGSGDVVQDIIDDFIRKLQLPKKYNELLRNHFEDDTDEIMDSYSAYNAARSISLPTMVIHDKNDDEVPVDCANHIYCHLPKGRLYFTSGLGHRKILGDPGVIKKIINFLEENEDEEIKNNTAAFAVDGLSNGLSGTK